MTTLADWSWVIALGVCGGFIALEGLTSRHASAALNQITQPPWAQPFVGWMVVGVPRAAVLPVLPYVPKFIA